MAAAHKTSLRALQKITSHFRISASGHLWPILIRKIIETACAYSCKSNPNLSANSAMKPPQNDRSL